MKKIFILFFSFLMLLILSACGGGGGSDNNDEIVNIVLKANKTTVAADNSDSIIFTVEGYDKDNNMLSVKNPKLYKDGAEYNSTTFKTNTAGTYKFIAELDNLTSNELTITATEVINTEDNNAVITIEENTKEIIANTEITTVYTNISEENYNNASSELTFSTKNSYSPNLIVSENKQGNPILLGVNHRGESSSELSIKSTAKAMVLYDPFLLNLNQEDYAKAKQYVETSPEMEELEALIEAAIKKDPIDPLFNNESDILYEKSVIIAKKIRDNIAMSKKILIKRDEENYTNLGMSDDDKKNGDIYLYNKTACIYNAKIKTGDTLDKQFGTNYFLNRVPLFDYQIINWDQNGIVFDPKIITEQSSRISNLGNVYFGVEFEKQKTTTYYMLAVQVVFDVIGIGIDNIKAEDTKFVADLFAKHFSTVVEIINKNLIEKPNNIEEASKQAYDMIKAAASLGYKPVVDFVTDLAKEKAFEELEKRIKEKYISTTLRILFKKATLWATLGYNALDVGYVIWDINYAPDKYEKLGIQKDGKYPADAVTIESQASFSQKFWGSDNSVNLTYYFELKGAGASKKSDSKITDDWGDSYYQIIFDYKPIKDYEMEMNFQVSAEPESNTWTEYISATYYTVYTITNKYYEYGYLTTTGKIKSPTELIDFTPLEDYITSSYNQERNTYKIPYDYNYPIAGVYADVIFEYRADSYYIDDEGNEVLSNTHNWDTYFEIFTAFHHWAEEIGENYYDSYSLKPETLKKRKNKAKFEYTR